MHMRTSLSQAFFAHSRKPVISTWRGMNTLLDFVFYDTSALSSEEQDELKRYNTPLGHVLTVYPAKSRKPIKQATALEFAKAQLNHPNEPVQTVVVAGVGSSALGTASLARDVADYLGRPVAGIVSGLGLSDVTTEALGGWFIFGAANTMREWIARGLDFQGFEDHVREQASHEAIRKHFEQKKIDPEWFIYGSPDSTALLYLLSKLGSRIKLLVGHSKGNYSIENALEGLHQISERSRTPIPADLQIVTLGAVIWFGPEFKHVHQFLGDVDLLGRINSRPDLNFTPIPGAWHSLNSRLPGHMPVSQALKLAGVRASDSIGE